MASSTISIGRSRQARRLSEPGGDLFDVGQPAQRDGAQERQREMEVARRGRRRRWRSAALVVLAPVGWPDAPALCSFQHRGRGSERPARPASRGLGQSAKKSRADFAGSRWTDSRGAGSLSAASLGLRRLRS